MSNSEKPTEDAVFVAITGPHALLRVEGRGSFKISSSLKEFGDSVIQKHLPLLLVDMSRCIGMDSTFMGVLAGVATRMKPHQGHIALVNCSPRTRGLLATLGLDQLLAAHETGQTPAALADILAGRKTVEQLTTTSGHDTATVRTMLEAHQDLVEVAPQTLPQFKDVLVYLREELNRKTAPPALPS